MHRNRALPVLVVLLLAFLAAPVIADVIYLKDGRKFTGKVVSESSTEVKFKSVGGVLTFKRKDVEKIEKGLTKNDEYEARRKKIASDDIAGLLELARWCEEQKLVAKKKKVYRELTKKVPNHPQVRRAMGQIYRDGKWVKKPKDWEPPTPRPGERKEAGGASVCLPKGWKVEASAMTFRATGPDPYAFTPVLTVTFSGPIEDPKTSFPEKEGWAKPAEASAAGLSGFRSRRTLPGEGGVERAEMLVILSGADHGMTVRLLTLVFEEGRCEAAVKVVLDSLKIKAPPADYTNEHYKYCLNLPKGEDWSHKESKSHDLTIEHTAGEALDYGSLSIYTGDEGEEMQDVQNSVNALVEILKETGDINERGKITLGGVEAEFVDATFLGGGVPLRQRLAWLTHRKRVVLFVFTQHEFGAKRTDEAWDILVKSFRFID
ncbi:MAG: hypothetical protein ABFS86_10220 [Planctomycetota bacterium]